MRGSSNTDRSDYGWAQVRENVSEKIGAYDNIKPVRMAHKVSRQNIDMILVRTYIRVFRRYAMKAFVPEWHGVDNPVGFCGRGQMLLSLAGQLESESEDTVDS